MGTVEEDYRQKVLGGTADLKIFQSPLRALRTKTVSRTALTPSLHTESVTGPDEQILPITKE